MQNDTRNLGITILDEEQIWGEERLEIFKIRGSAAAISDFAILLGGFVSFEFYTQDGFNLLGGLQQMDMEDGSVLEHRTGVYFTKTDDGDNDVRVVDDDSSWSRGRADIRAYGVRPALQYSVISNISSNKKRGIDGLLEVEYGEYPKSAVSKELQSILEVLYQSNNLNRTGKIYTIDSRKYNDYDKTFEGQEIPEFYYNGKKYIRVIANTCYNSNLVTLSNCEKYRDGDYVWVEVQPIKWLIDEKGDIAITKDIVFAGIPFNTERNYKGNFEKTDMYRYLNKHFIRDIIPSKINNLEYNNIISIKQQLINLLQEYKKMLKANELSNVTEQQLDDEISDLLAEINSIKKLEKKKI